MYFHDSRPKEDGDNLEEDIIYEDDEIDDYNMNYVDDDEGGDDDDGGEDEYTY